MLESLRRGETVVTTGGLIGRIMDIDGDILTLDLGETRVRVGRGFVSGLVDAKLPPAKEKKAKPAPKGDKAPKTLEEPETDDEAGDEASGAGDEVPQETKEKKE